ncbi:AraC family transcriptional regulator [Paenibacillus sanguinis]|uniref:AraC family transcriptional regulator n=1 Tax=Paenibacillus sanguinis TaxID=225906 RepID=UPI0003778658|nr:AraC family transcriptional regulator [Paenibacillus sanguinis]
MKAYHEQRYYEGGLPISTMQLHDFSFLAHWHQDVELIYITTGRVRVGINSESWLLQAGDLAICSSGDIHYYDSSGQESAMLLVIFNPKTIGAPGGWPDHLRLLSPYVGNAGHPDTNGGWLANQAAELMHQMHQEERDKSAHYQNIMLGLLYQLNGLILRHVPSEPLTSLQGHRFSGSRQAMREALDYLEKHWSRPITLEEAARQAHMSVYHFSRTFKSTTGMSLPSYLNSIRVDRAEELIRTSDQTMLDIALECGFTNVRTFNRAFRQLRGCAPSSLR